MTVKHIHDQGYKRLFSSIVFFQQLLITFVQEDWVAQLDFEHCEKVNKSYVSEKYQETTSDLLYKIPLLGQDIYICVLIEFQSTCPRHMAVRVAHYILSFYLEQFESNKGLKTVPPVFPIVLYNGKANWTAPTQLAELIDNHHLLGQFSIDFQYFKIVQKDFSVSALEQINNLVSTLFLVDNHYDYDKMETAFLALFDKQQHEHILLLMDWFLFHVENGTRIDEDYQKLKQACRTKQGSVTMIQDMIAREREKFRQEGRLEGKAEGRAEGRAEGKAEGKAEGRVEGKAETALNLLNAGVDISIIAQCTGLSEAEIRQLQDADNLH